MPNARRSWSGRIQALAVLAAVVAPGAAVPASAEAPPWPLALPRGTADVRVEYGPDSAWTETTAHEFVNIPRMSATFVAAEDETNLAVTFSAEARTSAEGKRMFVRARVDGVVASPADVCFTESRFSGARAFSFTKVVGRGVHTVEMQWVVDPGAAALVRAAGLLLRHGPGESSTGTVTHHAAPSGANELTAGGVWHTVPNMSRWFFNPGGASPVVAFSAETIVPSGNQMMVRALIDGDPLPPGEVVFAQRAPRQAHRMSFGGPPLGTGWHLATIEWRVLGSGSVQMGDRTMVVTSFQQTDTLRHQVVVPPSGVVSTDSEEWSTVPGFAMVAPIPPNGEVAVTFSGEVQALAGQLEMRLVANGVPSHETAVLAINGLPFEAQSFTFDVKNLFTTTTGGLAGLALEWRATYGTVVSMGDRALELVIEPGLLPDLAEAPAFGPDARPIEAAIGTRKVLTIIHRVKRAAPNNVIPTTGQVADALFGPTGVADYYDRMSGGRFHLESAGVLQYDALKTEGHYWDHGPYGCDQLGTDGFTGGHQERWVEAMLGAEGDIDFRSFDTDRDGVLEPQELAILIIAPQLEPFGTTPPIEPYCSGAAFTVDGVIVPKVSEWFTSNPSDNWTVAAHELAHLLFDIDDMYMGKVVDTEAGVLSLMSDNLDTTTHLDAPHKLALGWATPYYPQVDGEIEIEDVKLDGNVVVLPRSADGDGKEFFVLENRQDDGGMLYDTGTEANGVVVWHVVEDPSQNAQPPACMTAVEWTAAHTNLRRGVRMVRPSIDFDDGDSSTWDSYNFDLLDSGLVCPGGEEFYVHNALLWADGGASGWSLTGFSSPASTMTVVVDVP